MMSSSTTRFGNRFWQAMDQLVHSHSVVLDRPEGSAHPNYPGITYPHDYGYLDGTSAIDGDGVDCWVGSLVSHEVTGVVVTVDLHKRDAEVKILIGCTLEEMTTIETHHNGQSQSGMLVVRQSAATPPL